MEPSILGHHHDTLIQLRKHIHSHPELSHKETNTSEYIISFLEGLPNPPEIEQDIGGGFIAIFNNSHPDKGTIKSVVFRSELDAVPVQELNDFEHKSSNLGVSHKCGHDGHMAIVLGLAIVLSYGYLAFEGRVILLFQPAEETGTGAQQMISSSNPIFRDILNSKDTFTFALHNVPGFPKGTVVLPRGDSFASASKGMHVKLKGATTHASQPHLGKNPVLAVCNILQGLMALPSLYIPFDQKAMVTIVGLKGGDKAFGVAAGDAEVMATLRATTDTAMKTLEHHAIKLIQGIATTYDLSVTIGFEDVFAATINDPACVSIVQRAASLSGMQLHYMGEAFPWSEDFGIFLQHTKGAMFGLGMGETHAPLHNEYYDFPDSEIPAGVSIFAAIVSLILGQQPDAANSIAL